MITRRAWMRRPPWSDVALAAAMTAYGLYDVLGNHSWPGRPGVDAVIVTVMTASLAFRRVVPMAVMVVVGGAIVLEGFLYGSVQSWSTMFPFVVAAYSVAAYHSSVIAAVAVVLATVVLRDHYDPYVRTLRDRDFTITLTALTLLAGLEGRRQRKRRDLLDDRADALVREEESIAATAAADERVAIARELHDIISHGLGLIVLQAGAAEQVVGNDPERARQVLASIRSTGQEAVGELGALLGAMHQTAAATREPQPTLDDIDRLVDRVRTSGAEATIVRHSTGPAPSAALQVSAYRVVQEALTNAIKHAPGAPIAVSVDADERRLQVRIVNGPGGTDSASGSRRGLAGLAERVSIFGGSFHAGPTAPGGWEVRAVFPVRR